MSNRSMHSWQSPRNTPRSSGKEKQPNTSPLATTCLQIVDLCLLGTLFFCPLFFGGRHPLGRFVFILFASIAGVAWAARQVLIGQGMWTRNWGNVLGFAAILLVAFQLMPLPPDWLELLAPRNMSLVPLWENKNISPHLKSWETLSLTPSSTRIALATLVAYVLLFVTAVGRLQQKSDIERMIRVIGLAVIAMSCFGLLQYCTSNGLFFWFYEHPYTNTSRAVKGSFTTRNHFAHFITLGIGPLLAWIVLLLRENTQRTMQNRPESYQGQLATACALFAGLAVTVLAVLLTFSRGGAAVLAITIAITTVIYYRRGLLSGSYFYGLVALGLLILSMLSVSGYEDVAHRLDDFTAGSIEELDKEQGRRKIWRANIEATKEGSFFGSGAGSHREIYPIYLHESLPKEYTHAESGYLQTASENGFIGIAILALFILLICSWCWRSLRNANSKKELALAGAVTASLAASIIHSTVDFVWYVPSCVSLTILLAACVLRLAQLTSHPTLPKQHLAVWSKPRLAGLATLTACAAVWATITTVGSASASLHWDKYLLASNASKKVSLSQLLAAKSESEPEHLREQQLRTEAMIFHLQNALAHDPANHRVHLRLAGRYQQLFSQRQSGADNEMSIDQIRDAAIASEFPSANAQRKWLLGAFGENIRLLYRAHYHTHQSLKLCPLQGDGYLYLANLCFLEGHNRQAIGAYIDQGLQVRPHDGEVLVQAGHQLLVLQETQPALNLWKKAYRDKGRHQIQIIKQLVQRQFPAELFLDFFKPDWQTLQPLWDYYQLTSYPTYLDAILKYAEVETANAQQDYPPAEAADIWKKLAHMQSTLEHHDAALLSSQQAYQLNPNSYGIRRTLSQNLLHAKRYALAEPHLRWCLARQPNNKVIQKELIQATKKRLPNVATSSTDSHYQ